MGKFDRLQELHRIFKSRRYPISEQMLADELECAQRTVQRYLKELRDTCNAPLVKDAELGWRYEDPDNQFHLAGLWFTTEELISLTNLLHIIDNMESGLLQEELHAIEQRIESMLDKRGISLEELKAAIKILPSHKQPVDHPLFEQINQALINNHRLRIRYQNYSGKRSKREVSPQQLAYYQDNWYLDAWCHFRQELRQFKLSRIHSTDAIDRPAKRFSKEELDEHFAAAYGIFAGKPTQTAELIFSGNAARDVALQRWHPDQTGQWQDNQYHLTIPYSNDTELIRDLLAFGNNVTVKSPQELQNKLIETAKEIVAKYENTIGH